MEYKERLGTYLDRAFSTAPHSAAVREAKMELLADLGDRYDALLAQGDTPQGAYNGAIASIGDIFELVDSVAERAAEHVADHTAKPLTSRTFLWLSIVAVGALLGYLLVDGAGPRPPHAGLGNTPLELAALGIALFVGAFLAGRWLSIKPVGAHTRWYPAFTAILWVIAVPLWLFTLETPHLRRFAWVVLVLALAIHSIVRHALSGKHEGGGKR